MLKTYNSLPTRFKNVKVKMYYTILKRRQADMRAKRIFDLFFAVILSVLLSPVMAVAAILIKLDSPGPVFYRQMRVTQYGRTFRIYKFRTMCTGADSKGPLVTGSRDARITKVGEKMRRLRIDEIPQLFNVIRGEMSFVGTRPEVPKYVDAYTDEMMATLLLPAGITSPASIRYKDESELLGAYTAAGEDPDTAYIHKILPEKMEINLAYIRDFGFFSDIKIMFETLRAVFR